MILYICERCGKEHDGSFGSGRFCCRACANARVQSEAANRARSEKRKGKPAGGAILFKGKPARNRATLENGGLLQTVCPVCNKSFTYHRYTSRKYCSRKCWDTVSGGYREGSVKNYIHGTYEGYYYDSSYELVWIKWALKNKVCFERNKVGFSYIYKGEEHKYYPDFYLPEKDEYVEIKGIDDDLWKAKKLAFPKKLTVLKKKDIEALEKDLI